ncbi:MAG TPA: MFS transporter, partial [Mycobacteriales bacterium]|nr:MFS transporter [Mycobacteriales bacterium]
FYVSAALCARTIARDRLGPSAADSARLAAALLDVVRGVAQGAGHLRERGPAARALAAMTAHRFFYGLSFMVTLLLYTSDGAIGRGFSGLGQVVVLAAAGGLLAALVTPSITRRLGTQWWIVMVFVLAAGVELLAMAFTHAAFLLAALFLGFAAQAAKICVDTLLGELVDDDFRGRVFSFYDTAFNLSFVSAALASAVLLPPNGKSYLVIGLIAGGYAGTALLYGVATWLRAPGEPLEPILSEGREGATRE